MNATMIRRSVAMEQAKEPRASVLFVEEDKNTCNRMAMLLTSLGCQCDSASTLSEGLKLAKGKRYDLIILDWYFDDGTGVDLCELIRSFDTQTPILFYTGVMVEGKLERARNAGAQGFLNKPIDLDELTEAVKRYVKKERTASGH